MCIPCKIYVIM